MTIHVLGNADLLTGDERGTTYQNGAVAFSEDSGDLLYVGDTAEAVNRYPDAEFHDHRGKLVMPGMVNTHTHLFQTLLKGLGADKVLSEWFTSMTAPAATQLTWEDCYLAALHGCVEALTTGTTTLLDFMYVHPGPELLDAVIAAMQDCGIRGVAARGYVTAGADVGMPSPLIESIDDALDDAQRLIAKHNHPDSLVTVGLAPCMSWSVDEPTLRETRRLANDTGALITMHLAESDFDVAESVRRFGARDSVVLERAGLLGPDLVAVHCVQCNEDDLRRLAATETGISHNPCSNLYLGSGIAPVPAMLAAGVNVGLATDGPASSNNLSMLDAMKFAALVPKGLHRDPRIMSAGQVIGMATLGGARAMGMGNRVGSLEIGKAADILVIDESTLSIAPVHDPAASLVYSHRGDEVCDVWVAGRLVVCDRRPTMVDVDEVRRRSIQAARELAHRAAVAP